MANNDTGAHNAKGKKNFNAFSNMDMSSLWDMNKLMDAQRKNMEAMKQAQGIFTETFKELSDLNTKIVQQNVEKVKATMQTMSANSKDSKAIHEQLNLMKQHQLELTEKMKNSTGKLMEDWKAKVEEIKDYHAKMMAHLNEHNKAQTETFKHQMDEAKVHQMAMAESWKNSTQKIMDLMKNTANSFMNSR